MLRASNRKSLAPSHYVCTIPLLAMVGVLAQMPSSRWTICTKQYRLFLCSGYCWDFSKQMDKAAGAGPFDRWTCGEFAPSLRRYLGMCELPLSLSWQKRDSTGVTTTMSMACCVSLPGNIQKKKLCKEFAWNANGMHLTILLVLWKIGFSNTEEFLFFVFQIALW